VLANGTQGRAEIIAGGPSGANETAPNGLPGGSYAAHNAFSVILLTVVEFRTVFADLNFFTGEVAL
jgi:hypothetical protein